MSILFWIIFGTLVGWTATMIMGGQNRQGILGDIVLGVAGAFLGGLLMELFGISSVLGLNIYSIITSIVGAISLVWLGRLVFND